MDFAFRLQVLRLVYGAEDLFRLARMPARQPPSNSRARRASSRHFSPTWRARLGRLLRDMPLVLPRQKALDDLLLDLLEPAERTTALVPDVAGFGGFAPLSVFAEQLYDTDHNGLLVWRTDWDQRRAVRDHFPIELLQAARLAAAGISPTGWTRHNWEAPPPPPLAALMARGLHDNHIHLTAATPFWDLLAAALRHLRIPGANPRPALRRERGWIDAGTEPERAYRLNLRRALLTVKALLIALRRHRRAATETPFAAFLRRSLEQADGPRLDDPLASFWPRVLVADPDIPGGGPSLETVWNALAGLTPFPASDGCELAREILEGFAWLRAGRRDAHYGFCFLQAVRLICWIYRGFRHGEGFYEFETAFDAVGGLIEAAGLTRAPNIPAAFRRNGANVSVPDPLAEIALRSLFKDHCLVHVELRHAVRLPERRPRTSSGSRERRLSDESLCRKMNAYQAASERVGREVARARRAHGTGVQCPPTAVFPIHLIRRPEKRAPVCRLGVPVPFPLDFSGLWRRAEVIVDLMARWRPKGTGRAPMPGRMRLETRPVPIDVASNEDNLPNWVMAAAFAEIRERHQASSRRAARGRLSFQAHAGEHFHHPLQGLRRLWETVKFMKPLRRIGHALALDTPRQPSYTLLEGEFFDDLVWASSLMKQHGLRPNLANSLEEGVMKRVRKRLADLSPSPSLHDLWHAYASRFDRDRLVKSGLLRRVPGKPGLLHYRGRLEAGAATDRESRLFARSLALSLERRVWVDVGASMSDWLYEAYEELRPQVIALLRSSQLVIECCPSSNLSIAGYGGYLDHPAFSLLSADCLFTLNSDDPGIFQAPLAEEYRAVWEAAERREALADTDNRLERLEKIRERAEWIARDF